MSRNIQQLHPWLTASRLFPLSIAHRGASHYAYDNSLAAFEKAALLGADFWEVDVRTTADNVLVAYHDADLKTITGDPTPIASLHYDELLNITEQHQQPVEKLSRVLELAQSTSSGIYLDAKDPGAVQQSPALLLEYGIQQAVMACFDSGELRTLSEAGCEFPLAVLVPVGADPFELAAQTRADIIHLCWEHAGERPQDLITPELIDEARRSNLSIVLWHEERRDIVSELVKLPVLGICSNRPELLKPYQLEHTNAPAIACHRGANNVCPENTLEGAHCTFGAGYQYVELDVHNCADGELFVIHDDKMDRTTDGTGLVCDQVSEQIDKLDAGNWFNPFFNNTRIPRLSDMLKVARSYSGSLYVEIKTAPVCDVLDLVRQHDMLSQCFFWSFKQHYLSAIREQYPTANIMTRRKDYPTLDDAINFVNAEIIEFDVRVDDLREVDSCRQAGCKSMVAYNGDDPDCFTEILENRPDIVNLNRPDLLRSCLRVPTGH